MNAVIQPMLWGIAMATMLALASGVALDVVVESTQVAAMLDDNAAPAAGR